MKKILLATMITAFMLPTVATAEATSVELTLKETAEQKVEQDRIKATLRFEATGRTTAYVQEKVNRAMNAAVQKVKAYDSIDISTGRYNVHQVWNSKKRIHDEWKATQTVILDTANKEDVLKLSGELQKEGFIMNGLNFYLSREKEATYKNSLIAKALKLVNERAEVISKSIGKSTYEIKRINIGGNVFKNQNPQLMRGVMAMSSKMEMDQAAAPVVESSDQRISVSVDVMINIQ